MTEQIKVTKAWGHFDYDESLDPFALTHNSLYASVPVHIVSGLSDPEAAVLPEIMERTRKMCEWGTVSYKGRIGYWTLCEEWQRVCGSAVDTMPTHCVCGCKIKIVARNAGEGWW